MSATQTWILRLSIVLGMVAAVVTILYFTPMPEHHFKSCDRSCHELDWPMICRIKLTIEEYYTLSRSCQDCPQNITHCSNTNCVVGDGTRRSILAANRNLPGPNIQVCQNDILLVDVTNQIPGQEISLHWRGQHQQGTPVMDGVPMVTQCPISSYTTFQYKFRVSTPGTHYWHAFSNSQAANGIFGALIVKQPDVIEPQKRLYDIDSSEYLMIVTEMERKSSYSNNEVTETTVPFTLLINGRSDNIKNYKVKYGVRYRFRIIYASGKSGCPIKLSIDEHKIKVIALDGHALNPYEVDAVILGKGERIDFVLKATQVPDDYKIRITSECNATTSTVLSYEPFDEPVKKQESNTGSRVFRTDLCKTEIGRICLEDVQSLFVMPSALRSEKVDTKLYMTFNLLTINKYDSNTYRIYGVNNMTFTFPSSPLLTQFDDVSSNLFCDNNEENGECRNDGICECVHIEHIPLDDSVEIILIDNGGEKENIFHLHGYSFYVVGSRQFSDVTSVNSIKKLDEEGNLFKRNLLSPVRKDTIRIPKYGVVAIRFIASNPGYWMLRDELSDHWTRGADTIIQVGTRRDISTAPSDFPKCGNWVGPEFFLA